MENAAANRCGRNHPGERRAGCPHPAGPRGSGNVCGLIWPPCERGRKRRSGDCVERSRRSREPQFKTEEFLRHVASLKRHLAVRQSLRHGLRPCHLPLTREANAVANRETTNPAIPQTNVGDDARIVPRDPAPPQGPEGGPWPSPTNHGGRPANRCGRDHPDNRRAGCPHPAGPFGGGNVCGKDKSLPYKPRRARGQPGNRNLRVIINLCRGRCLHRPANLAAQPPAGGYGIRPYSQRQNAAANRETANLTAWRGRGCLAA